MYLDTTNKVTVENSDTESVTAQEIENRKTSSSDDQHQTMDEKTPDCVNEAGPERNELLGFISWKYFILYSTYLILFAIGFITPHVVQLWMDFCLCSLCAFICYISESISNQWIIFLFLAFTHAMLHYVYPFLDANGFQGVVVGITPFPDILCHSIMFIYAVWFLGFGELKDFVNFSKWEVSIWFKIFWSICIFGQSMNMVASLLIHDEDEAIHFEQAFPVFIYTSIFQAISTAFCWSAAIVNPLNCKSRKMIEYHIIPWLIGAIITWCIFFFYNSFMNIMVDHGYLQFLFIYPLIASLSIHFYDEFVSKRQ